MVTYYTQSSCCLLILFIRVVSGSAHLKLKDDLEMLNETTSALHLDCVPWYYCEDRELICNQVPYSILRCPNNQTVSVPGSTCVTFDETTQLLEVGKCLYSHAAAFGRLKYPIAEESIECKEMNRTGTLCSRCKDDHYPLAYSYDMNCVECPDGKSNWWKFLLAAFLPLTVFYFIIFLLKINITSSYLLGFVFHVQSISIPALIRNILHVLMGKPQYREAARIASVVYGIWNLDFLRSMQLDICLGTDTLQTLALDLAVGVYPLLLMVLSYLLIHLYDRNFRPLVIIWKPFRAIFGLFQRNWDMRTSLIDSFTAFFLLSNVKFLSVSFDLLAPVKVYQLNSKGKLSDSWRVYYNASLPYFGEEHLPYAILAFAALLLFVLLPTLLLFLYPFNWFQKCLNLFPVRWYILHTFMDSFQGCYKDGTQPGTHDCRWFASLPFVCHILLFVTCIFTFDEVFQCFVAVFMTIFTIIIVNLEPFKANHYTDTYAIFTLLTALLYGLTAHFFSVFVLIRAVALLTYALPFLYISAFTLRWMYRHKTFGLQLIRRFHAWRHGYEILE